VNFFTLFVIKITYYSDHPDYTEIKETAISNSNIAAADQAAAQREGGDVNAAVPIIRRQAVIGGPDGIRFLSRHVCETATKSD